MARAESNSPTPSPSPYPKLESPLPGYLRWAGPVLAFFYGCGVRLHRAAALRVESPIATICIGNLTAGGTGKTPAVIYFARELSKRGRRPAILMRGYKAQGNDEAEEVRTALHDINVPVFLGAHRYTSALKAVEQGCDVALLDDGFQHWYLSRDLDIVLIDALDPFGGGALLPQGRLREPVSGLSRAGAVLITHSEVLFEPNVRDALLASLKVAAPGVPVLFSVHVPDQVRALNDAQKWPAQHLNGMRIAAACGIGNPRSFATTLQQLHAQVADFAAFDDHHEFTQDDMRRLQERAKAAGATALVVTEKDAVKIEKLALPKEIDVLSLGVRFGIENADELWPKIDSALKTGDARRDAMKD